MILAPPTPVEVSTWSKTIPLSQVFWQYMNESNKFVDLPPRYFSKYEEHLREGNLIFEHDVPLAAGAKINHYEVNLPNMTQATRRQAHSGILDVSLCAIHNKTMELLHFMIATLTLCLPELDSLGWSTLCPHELAEGPDKKIWFFP